MSAKRDMNSVLLAAIEGTEGVAASLSAATDVVLVENLQVKFNQSVQSTQEVTGTLDPAKDIPIGGPAQITFDTWLKASGTAGNAPEIGKLLRACGYAETLTAAAIGVPTAATAGTSNSVTVPSSPFAGGVDAYKGMVAQLTVNPVGPLFTSILSFSAGQVMGLAETFTPILSTSTLVQIPKNALYTPISTGIPSLTFGLYKDGVYHQVTGGRGTFKMSWEAGKGIKLSWTFGGIMAFPRTDVANPTTASPDSSQAKLVWRNDSNNGAFVFNGARIGVQSFNFDNGTSLDNAPNPNQPAGFDVADIGSRTMKFDINPRLSSIAARDTLASVRTGATVAIEALARNSAGNSCAVVLPAAQPSSYEYGRQGPMISEQISGKATGNNSGAYLCFF